MNKLLEGVLDELCNRLKHIEERHGYLSHLIEKRFANEKMWQLEVMRLISLMPDVEHYLVEKPYGKEEQDKCDLWFKVGSFDYWLEVKTRPTNYRKGDHHSKAQLQMASIQPSKILRGSIKYN